MINNTLTSPNDILKKIAKGIESGTEFVQLPNKDLGAIKKFISELKSIYDLDCEYYVNNSGNYVLRKTNRMVSDSLKDSIDIESIQPGNYLLELLLEIRLVILIKKYDATLVVKTLSEKEPTSQLKISSYYGVQLDNKWLIDFFGISNSLSHEKDGIVISPDRVVGKGYILIDKNYPHGVTIHIDYVHELQNQYFKLRGFMLQLDNFNI